MNKVEIKKYSPVSRAYVCKKCDSVTFLPIDFPNMCRICNPLDTETKRKLEAINALRT